jgi:drug/metabolite transporter (DMT)-like permease
METKNKTKDFFQYVLGGMIVLGFFSLIGILILHAIPEPNRDLLNVAFGGLITSFIAIVTYFYGSSKGSSDKNEMLTKKSEQ